MRRGIRWPQTIAVLAALSVLQVGVFDQFWIGGRVRIDLLQLLLVSIGLTVDIRRATMLGFVIGLSVDLFRFGPFGLHALIYCLAAWVLASNGARMLQVGPGFRIAQGTVAVLLVTAATWSTAAVFGQRPPAFGNESLIDVGLAAIVGGVALGAFGRLTTTIVSSDPGARSPRGDLVRVE
jgi:rod shape-determining protein MreD